MKKIFILIVIVSCILKAQSTDWKKMVDTEYAFAAKAGETNMRESFLSFISDDGILFKPHPLNGKEFLEKSKPRSGLLKWYPSISEISSSGDMGFTSGPWSFRKEKNDTADNAFGDFCTIWEKQKDGSWKFAIDFGVSHEKYKTLPVAFSSEYILEENNSHTRVNPTFIITSLDDSKNIQSKAYSPKTRLLVDDNYPIDGGRNIQNYFREHSLDNFLYQPAGGKISKANDFGFTYGLMTQDGTKDKIKKEIYYMRIWQKENDDWKILAEVWNDKPTEKKN